MGWGLIAHALDNMVASHISLNHGYAWGSLGLAFHCDFLIVEWSIIDRGTAPNEVGLWRLWRDKSNLCTLLPLDVGLDLPFSIMLSIIGLLVLWQWLMSWELYSLTTWEREREREGGREGRGRGVREREVPPLLMPELPCSLPK